MKDDMKDKQWRKDTLDGETTDEIEFDKMDEFDNAEPYEDTDELFADEEEFEDADNKVNKETTSQAQPIGSGAETNVEPNYWKWASIISLFVIAALVVALIMNPFSSNETLADVNGTVIDKDMLYDKMYSQNNMGEQMLDQMVTEELIKQEVDKQKISIPESEIDKMLADIRKNIPSEEEFQSALAQQGMTIEILRERLKTQLQLKKVFEPQIKITDEEVKKFFDENQAQFAATPEQVQVAHILVNTQEEADAIIAELKAGADFAALAKEKSIEPAAKESGGDLGPPFAATGSNFDPDFVAGAFSVEKGEITKAIKTQFGYHVIKVNDRIPAVSVTFESKKEEIKAQLFDQQMGTLIGPWIQELKDKAGIKPPASATPAPPEQ
ncbi:MAG TPA: peptidyl-prolyl cis-trans isomerase [Bacilli bacterium]